MQNWDIVGFGCTIRCRFTIIDQGSVYCNRHYVDERRRLVMNMVPGPLLLAAYALFSEESPCTILRATSAQDVDILRNLVGR